jgi:hypothetical protein
MIESKARLSKLLAEQFEGSIRVHNEDEEAAIQLLFPINQLKYLNSPPS